MRHIQEVIRLEGGNEYREGSENLPCDERRRAFDERQVSSDDAAASQAALTPSREALRLARMAAWAAKLAEEDAAESAEKAAKEAKRLRTNELAKKRRDKMKVLRAQVAAGAASPAYVAAVQKEDNQRRTRSATMAAGRKKTVTFADRLVQLLPAEELLLSVGR